MNEPEQKRKKQLKAKKKHKKGIPSKTKEKLLKTRGKASKSCKNCRKTNEILYPLLVSMFDLYFRFTFY